MIKSFFKNSLGLLAVTFLVVGSFFVATGNVFAAGLGVTEITAVKTFATADGTFANGWSWVFDVTVPEGEKILNMKFADWVSGSNIIPASGNMRFYSAQSSNAFDSDHAITINAAGEYSAEMNLNPSADLDSSRGGGQIEITIEAAVPNGSAGGSYSTSYGIKSSLDATAPTITLNGDNPQIIERTSSYVELGATALDNINGVVNAIPDDSSVDTYIAGTYTVTYTATDAATVPNTATATRTVNVVDTVNPVITISNYTTEPTNQDITVIATTNEGTLNAGSHTFTNNDSFDFVATDTVGNVTTQTVTISNIDKVVPTATVSYDVTAPTNGSVIATITPNETVVGNLTYTFISNGSYTFNFTDLAGNVGSVTATVLNIDKTAPTATVSYDVAAPTNGSVIATITPNETATVTNNGGALTYTFTANGSFTFDFIDTVGNVGSVTATVSNIDTVAPTATVGHDESAKTITYTFSEPVQLTNADGTIVPNTEYASSLAVYDSVLYLAHTTGQDEPARAVDISSAILSGDATSIVITYTGSLIKNANASYIVDAWGRKITDLVGNKMVQDAAQIFTVTGDTTFPTATVGHDESAKTITYTFSEPVQLTNADGTIVPNTEYASSLAVYDSVLYLAHTTGQDEPARAVDISSAILSGDATSIVITYTGSLIKNANASYIVDAWGRKITDLVGNKMVQDAAQIFTVTGDTDAPTLAIVGFTANSVSMNFNVDNYLLNTDGKASTNYFIQFASGSTASENLKNEIVELSLVPTDGQTSILQTYYSTNFPSAYEAYLKDAAAGNKPFAYIKTNGTEISLLDGAQKILADKEVNMIIPGNYPAGTYTVKGKIHDMVGNETNVTFILNVVPSFNGTESGNIITNTGVVSGTITGTYTVTISGQVTAYVENRASFSGTVSGDINGLITADINSNGIDTMSGMITGTGATGPVRIIGTFPQTGTDGDFIGEIITGSTPMLVSSMTIKGENNIDTVTEAGTLQMIAELSPFEAANKSVAWSVWTSDNIDRATINESGVLTGISAGSVTVIAKALDGSLQDATKAITIIASIPVQQ